MLAGHIRDYNRILQPAPLRIVKAHAARVVDLEFTTGGVRQLLEADMLCQARWEGPAYFLEDSIYNLDSYSHGNVDYRAYNKRCFLH